MQVFFGAFRGRGFTTGTTAAAARPAYTSAQAPATRRTGAAAANNLDEAPEADAGKEDTDVDEDEEQVVKDAAQKAPPSPSPAPSSSVPQL